MTPEIERLLAKWHGKWAVYAVVKNPSGGMVEMKAELRESEAKRFAREVLEHMKQNSNQERK